MAVSASNGGMLHATSLKYASKKNFHLSGIFLAQPSLLTEAWVLNIKCCYIFYTVKCINADKIRVHIAV